MADAMWNLTDDGEWVLQEPYATLLKECRVSCTRAWHEALVTFLVEHSDYDAQFLSDELLRRNERPEGKVNIFEEFVLEALSGDL